MIATIVDWDALLQVIWVSLVAGVGVTAAYGFAILGASRALESGRDGRPAEAAVLRPWSASLGVARSCSARSCSAS